MNRSAVYSLTGILFFCLCVSVLQAQDASQDPEGEQIHSMGIPSRYEWSLSHLLSPLYGVGLTGEGYVEKVHGEKVDGGVRLLGGVKMLFFNVGVDHKFGDESTDFMWSKTEYHGFTRG